MRKLSEHDADNQLLFNTNFYLHRLSVDDLTTLARASDTVARRAPTFSVWLLHELRQELQRRKDESLEPMPLRVPATWSHSDFADGCSAVLVMLRAFAPSGLPLLLAVGHAMAEGVTLSKYREVTELD